VRLSAARKGLGRRSFLIRCFEPVEEADDGPQAVRFRAAAELTPKAVTVIGRARTRAGAPLVCPQRADRPW
jgi:hypothetical protein